MANQLIETGYWRCELKFRDCLDPPRVGLVSAGVGIDHGYELGDDENSIAYFSMFGCLTTNYRVLVGNNSFTNDDVVMLEFNMTAFPRTCHFFINKVQQQQYIRNLPKVVCIAVMLPNKHSRVEILSLHRYERPLARQLPHTMSIVWAQRTLTAGQLTPRQKPNRSPTSHSSSPDSVEMVPTDQHSHHTAPLPFHNQGDAHNEYDAIYNPSPLLGQTMLLRKQMNKRSPLSYRGRQASAMVNSLKSLAPPNTTPATPLSSLAVSLLPLPMPHVASLPSTRSSSISNPLLASAGLSSPFPDQSDVAFNGDVSFDHNSPTTSEQKRPSVAEFESGEEDERVVVVQPAVSSGIVRLVFSIESEEERSAFGIIDATSEYSSLASTWTAQRAVVFAQHSGFILSPAVARECHQMWSSGDEVSVEADLSSSPSTLSFFINGSQQGVSIHSLPTHIAFFIVLAPHSTLTVHSFSTLPVPTARPFPAALSFSFPSLIQLIPDGPLQHRPTWLGDEEDEDEDEEEEDDDGYLGL
ncbi:hypothetical protein BLNAU_16601 [Blattamonas nauphoetae]|uniref:SPRY domain-containing protein n=1 Tax=Blattamonas nauphoetae TaxID=2049346 RepID=A0ABQ9X927_9EUKA|nr:hypothetical protein BLNAU_16601 [Blattamonas nauphoetae]